MILFIKHWAKIRGINTPYRGSLSSYGYVLMVLHYLVNVAQPFVCPNLQAVNKDPPPYLPPTEIEARTVCNGRDVRFWRNEAEIKNLADKKMLNHNHDTIGILLRGFFEYYAQSGAMSTVQHRGFDWGREVLSLRTIGGILTKQEKGWVGAKTVFETSVVAPPTPSTATPPKPVKNNETTPAAETPDPKPTKPPPKAVEETKEIRHRYLFAIEDPFELDHNVARTVTHNGIVSIRDEFRRAWRIIRNVGKPEQRDGGLLDPLDTNGGANTRGSWRELMELIHGLEEKKEIGVDAVKGSEGV
jgi:DNA polymerase sigma